MDFLSIFISLLSLLTGNGASHIDEPAMQPSIQIEAEANILSDNVEVELIAKCLTAKGAKLYGSYWCSHCNNQKEMFGDSIDYIEYIECDERGENGNPEACTKAGIKAYPTWIFDEDNKITGSRSPEALAEITGCP